MQEASITGKHGIGAACANATGTIRVTGSNRDMHVPVACCDLLLLRDCMPGHGMRVWGSWNTIPEPLDTHTLFVLCAGQ